MTWTFLSNGERQRPTANSPADTIPKTLPLTSGTFIGPYEVLTPLGAGGMGEVYRARDGRLGREVALKVLSTDLAASGDHLRRFEQEARAASALNHPNIITIYEIGRVDSLAYIAMELIEGRDVRSLLSGEQLPAKQAVRIAVKVADGMAAAHERGIVHRDLKPENLMVSRDGYVKILDFGLAKLVRPFTETDTTLPHTTPGAVFGTVGYMSPEQAAGKAVDYRSDQFALGVILYEMLAGRLPFHAPSAAETLAAIIRTDPKPISLYNESVPVELTRIVERLLSKDPQDRYTATRDLSHDLREVRDRITGGADARGRSIPPAVPSSRTAWTAIAAMAGLALAIGSVIFIKSRSQEVTANPPKPPVQKRPPSPYDENAVPAELTSAEDRAAYVEALGLLRRSQDQESVDRAIATLTRLLNNARDSAPLNSQLARAFLNKAGLARRPSYLKQATIHAERAVAIDPSHPETHIRLGQVRLTAGDDEAAAQEFQRALTLRPDEPDAVVGLAATYESMGRRADAEQMYRKAIELRPDHANTYNRYGAFLADAGRYEEAVQKFRRFTELMPTARGFSNLGETLQALGDYDEALRAHEKSISLEPTTDGYIGLGNLYYYTGRPAEADRAYEQAAQIAPTNYNAWVHLGDARRWTPGMQDKAAQAYQKGLMTASEALAANPRDALAQSAAALCLSKLGRLTEANVASASALRIDPTSKQALYAAAVVALLVGSTDEAVGWLERAVDNGYPRHDLEHDPELRSLQKDPAFRRALEKR